VVFCILFSSAHPVEDRERVSDCAGIWQLTKINLPQGIISLSPQKHFQNAGFLCPPKIIWRYSYIYASIPYYIAVRYLLFRDS